MRSTVSTSTIRSKASPKGFASGDTRVGFRSHIPAERRFKIENLFKFERGKADLLFSLIVVLMSAFVLLSFNRQSMFDHRVIPGDGAGYSFADYMGYQFDNAVFMAGHAAAAFMRGEPLGAKARKKNDPKLDALPRLDWPYEGRLPRFGKILLKAPWVMPLIFVVLLVPAVIFNALNSYLAARKRAKERRPNRTLYELSYWLRALEYVAYFILYTFLVPILGYLAATLILIPTLAWRQGYRTWRWFGIGVIVAFGVVLVFRTGLQIKTPNSIWLYNQLPVDLRAFMLTYF